MKIFTLTHWQIRLLSKSPLIVEIAKRIPAEYQSRMIYGLSTGTLDDNLAKCIEISTPLASNRIKALHYLQHNGYRTFGMLCPSLPQDDYDSFSQQMSEAVRVGRCEHVWAEILNARGESMRRTCDALRNGGFSTEAARLMKIATDPDAWEEYSRSTFLAHTRYIPSGKLRFLQYPKAKHLDWWRGQAEKGAVLLGKAAHLRNLDRGEGKLGIEGQNA